LASEKAIRSVQSNWKQVRNGNVVSVFLAFTNSGFGDSSLIFVTDYHPLAETLAQRHFTPASRFPTRHTSAHIPEQMLWGYIVQLANALKAIHHAGLAARVMDPSKVLLTGENRIRLNACAIMDVVQHDSSLTLPDLQRQDLCLFGRLILALGTNNLSKSVAQAKAMESFSRPYTSRLRDSVSWLLSHDSPDNKQDIDVFLASIAADIMSAFDSSLHLDDELNTNLNRELENSRVVRLLTKLNFINERPEYEHDRQWAEQGNRYILQLFRDYVFHQVDAQGNPVLDLAHVLACLNKLDVGIEEKITLTARDENTVVVVSYREVRTAVEAAWGDLMRRIV
jgi:PAB-dependent poly(A)-specific ribonuclease subunit 3